MKKESPSDMLLNNETKFIVHHIGGRGWAAPFRVPEMFLDDVAYVFYEADPDSIKEMQAGVDALPEEAYVAPYCLWSSRAKKQLNITANVYASSLYTPSDEFKDYTCELEVSSMLYDITYDDMLKVVRKVDVNTHTIDDLVREGVLPYNRAPDFISVDTQGAELDIIEGGRKAVTGSVLGICSEVELQRMYEGQPLYGELFTGVRELGFEFASFVDLYFVSPTRTPIGWRGKLQPGFGDALFLRSINSIVSGPESDDDRYLKLMKLAFASVVFEHTDFAVGALRAIEPFRSRVSKKMLAAVRGRAYGRFVEDIRKLLFKTEPVYPPLLGIPGLRRANAVEGKSWFDTHHQAAVTAAQEDGEALNGGNRAQPLVDSLKNADAFEALLRNHGFTAVANTVVERRKMAEKYLSGLTEKMLQDGQ